MRKYLITGEEVEVIEKTSTGYIVQRVYVDEDDDEFEEFGKNEIASKVFDNPPKASYEAKVKRLIEQIDELETERMRLTSEVGELLISKRQLASEQAKTKKLLEKAKSTNKALERLDLFLDGKITHYIHHSESCVQVVALKDTKSEYSDNLRLLALYGDSKGDLSWRLKKYSDWSSGGEWEVIPCTSEEEARALARPLLMDALKRAIDWESRFEKLCEYAKKLGVTVPAELLQNRRDKELEALQKQREKAVAELDKVDAQIAKLGSTVESTAPFAGHREESNPYLPGALPD